MYMRETHHYRIPVGYKCRGCGKVMGDDDFAVNAQLDGTAHVIVNDEGGFEVEITEDDREYLDVILLCTCGFIVKVDKV